MQNYIILKAFLFFVLILLFTLMPDFGNSKNVFGVAIPPKKSRSEHVLKIKKLYRYLTAASGLLFASANILACIYADVALSDILMQLFLAAYFVCVLLFYYMAHKSINILKKRLKWTSPPPNDQAPVIYEQNFTESKLAPSPWWFSAHALLIALTAALLYFMYPYMLDYLPIGIDLSGKAIGHAPKSLKLISLPVLAQVFITLICGGAFALVKYSRLRLDPADAAASLSRSRNFRIVWSSYAIILGFVLDLLLLISAQFMYITPQLRYLMPYVAGSVLILIVACTLFLGFKTASKR